MTAAMTSKLKLVTMTVEHWLWHKTRQGDVLKVSRLSGGVIVLHHPRLNEAYLIDSVENVQVTEGEGSEHATID